MSVSYMTLLLLNSVRSSRQQRQLRGGGDESIRGGHRQQVRFSLVHRRTLASD